MVNPVSHCYEFEPFCIDPARRLLLREGKPVPLTPKAFETLLVLVEKRGQIVAKDELMKLVWPDTAVEENNLAHNVFVLRKALGETADEHRYIITVPGRGYRFVADVRATGDDDADLLIAKRARSRMAIQEEVVDGGADSDFEAKHQSTSRDEFTRSDRKADSRRRATRPMTNQRYERPALLILTISMAVAGVAFAINEVTTRKQPRNQPAAILAMPVIRELLHTGNAGDAAISPDGKYVAYKLTGAGRQSLWLMHLATGSNQEIVQPADYRYYGLAFSHEGSHIYFVRSERNNPLRTLYKMPLLGGVPTKLIDDLKDVPGFSPDGEQVAFVRESPNQCALMIANVEGTGERTIATHNLSKSFWSPTWSPDSKFIACVVGSGEAGGANISLIEVRVEDGSERMITAQKWTGSRNIAWSPDGSGLIVTGRDVPGPHRVWHVSYPEGEVRRITNDSISYVGISLTDDADTLVTSKSELRTSIWTAPIVSNSSSPAIKAQRITSGTSNFHQVCWLRDGRLAYSCSVSSPMDIWTMNSDGSNQKQLTANTGINWFQSASSDGRYLVFESDRTGSAHIWRMDIDGNNSKQLTSGSIERFPDCSPDGKWVVYNSVDDWTLWKVPIDGGQPVQLTNSYSLWPAVSPDGKWIAYFSRDAQPDSQYRLSVIPFDGGPPLETPKTPKTFGLPPIALTRFLVQWTPDGKALTYAGDRDGVSNIWSQPLDGGKPAQMTDFKSDQIFYFDWSRDGKQLVCSRGAWTGDLVLISNFKR